MCFVAIGPRPLLDLPDKITVPQTGVRIASERTILVSNFGRAAANFAIQTTYPFTVDIDRSILEVNQQMQLTIFFVPVELGPTKGTLELRLNDDVKLFVSLEGDAVNRNVKLEKSSVEFDGTYMGLTAHETVKLINDSDNVLMFKWKLFETEYLEQYDISKLKNAFYSVKEHESMRGNILSTMEIIGREGHSKVYDRIYRDEVRELEGGGQFLFSHKNFKITPQVMSVLLLCFRILISFTFEISLIRGSENSNLFNG